MDREALARLAARYARRAKPVSLTLEELDFEHHPVTRVVPGVPVWAWIRFPGSAELVAGETFGWTLRAVQVCWTHGGIRRTTWVWASAVSRRDDPTGKTALGERTVKGR
ncbi:hypothetical protein D477_006703 [Arthrobacter crystallopoietes BAB-32]|uniref:Uncharacterized protein n=1 Tax=Arthrobacter crystallopoietes BAB-32 TaxID=1246476 RepID=N1V9N9_9MICC|nr:hypothetical protein [Arthrobacter crystallopoietes]EMY35003.1 hypothetical protein D477_006703 [Arthrobacter crystallopoietes BAB-32]